MKTAALICITLSILLTTGCWDYAEYEDMALISSIGIDCIHETNSLKITIENSSVGTQGNQSQSGQAGEKSKSSSRELYTVQARSIPEAINKLQQVEERELFFGYVQVIVMNSEAAKKCMKEIISFFSYTSRIRKSAYLYVTPKSAQDVLSSVETGENFPAAHRIVAFTQQSARNATFFPVTLREFNIALTTKGMQPVVPLINVTSSNDTGGTDESGNTDAMPEDVEDKPGTLHISGMGVFKGDSLVGQLDEIESTGLGIILNKNISNYINLKSEDDNAGILKNLSFRVRNINTDIKTGLDNNRVVIDLKVDVKWRLEQFEISDEALSPDTIKKLENALAGSIKEIVTASLEKGQKKLGSDIFDFGNVFYRQHTKEWDNSYEKKWDALFPNMTVNVDVKSHMLEAGLAIRPMQKQ